MEKHKIKLNFSSTEPSEVSHAETHNKLLKNNYFYPSNINSAINKKFSCVPNKSAGLDNKIRIGKLVKNVNPFTFREKGCSKASILDPEKNAISSFSEHKSTYNFTSVSQGNHLISSNQIKLNKSSYTEKASISQLRSSTGRLLTSQMKYQTDLDLNSVAEKKFYRDACETGKNKLATVSVRLSSPDRYNNLESSKNKKRMNNINIINASSCLKIPSANVLTDLLDSQYSNISSTLKKKINNHSNEDKNYMDDDIDLNLSFIGESCHGILFEAFDTFRCLIEPIYESLNSKEKINKIFEYLDDIRKNPK